MAGADAVRGGLAGDHQAWKPQIGEWSKQFHIVAPDSRGAGRSTQIDEEISTGDMAEDLLGLMSTLGIERFHVVGRSLGGAIGQRMVLKAPNRILSLAMLASYSALDPVGKRSLENMREVLELTRLLKVFEVHDTEEEALSAIPGGAGGAK